MAWSPAAWFVTRYFSEERRTLLQNVTRSTVAWSVTRYFSEEKYSQVCGSLRLDALYCAAWSVTRYLSEEQYGNVCGSLPDVFSQPAAQGEDAHKTEHSKCRFALSRALWHDTPSWSYLIPIFHGQDICHLVPLKILGAEKACSDQASLCRCRPTQERFAILLLLPIQILHDQFWQYPCLISSPRSVRSK